MVRFAGHPKVTVSTLQACSVSGPRALDFAPSQFCLRPEGLRRPLDLVSASTVAPKDFGIRFDPARRAARPPAPKDPWPLDSSTPIDPRPRKASDRCSFLALDIAADRPSCESSPGSSYVLTPIRFGLPACADHPPPVGQIVEIGRAHV